MDVKLQQQNNKIQQLICIINQFEMIDRKLNQLQRIWICNFFSRAYIALVYWNLSSF